MVVISEMPSFVIDFRDIHFGKALCIFILSKINLIKKYAQAQNLIYTQIIKEEMVDVINRRKKMVKR